MYGISLLKYVWFHVYNHKLRTFINLDWMVSHLRLVVLSLLTSLSSLSFL